MATVDTRQTDLVRYLQTNSTSSSFTVAEGIVTLATINALAVPVVSMNAYRGLPELSFFGTGADNSTFSYRVFTVERITQTNNTPTDVAQLMEVRLLLSGTATLSTLVGPSSSGVAILSTERVADSVGTVAQTGWCTQLQAEFGSAVSSYSPADNTRALIAVPDMGSVYGFIIDFQRATATACNALYRLTT